MANRDIDELIGRIMNDERMRQSAVFSEKVHRAEPILTTGRRMQNYLPDEYRKMRAVTRWQAGEAGRPGRWLTEAELFYRQGMLMAGFEDDCPYHGNFKSYYPTYNAMSDRQLRGYFTWRAAVRRGEVQETSSSFAFVYLYELINGIGVSDAADGFRKMVDFWQSYRGFEPELDRFVRAWAKDYVVYHGLPRELLAQSRTVRFDAAVMELKRLASGAAGSMAAGAAGGMAGGADNGAVNGVATGAAGDVSAGAANSAAATDSVAGCMPLDGVLPLPPDAELEEALFAALNELSNYRLDTGALNETHHETVRHVGCAVFARMCSYYRKSRKKDYIEVLFGEEATLPYTMFGSAVFFETQKHADTEYRLNDAHVYRCHNGFWECTRASGSRSKSDKLGKVMHAVGYRLREALGLEQSIPEEKMPKYLAKFVDEEIEHWQEWQDFVKAHEVKIDLSSLAGIRAAAADTRESLLVEEEREESAVEGVVADGAGDRADSNGSPQAHRMVEGTEAPIGNIPQAARGLISPKPKRSGSAGAEVGAAGFQLSAKQCPRAIGAEGAVAEDVFDGDLGSLGPAPRAYLEALLANNAAAKQEALKQSTMSEDLLVDAINEALFDEIGDTVIEYGADGPQIIEDYLDDLRGILKHE